VLLQFFKDKGGVLQHAAAAVAYVVDGNDMGANMTARHTVALLPEKPLTAKLFDTDSFQRLKQGYDVRINETERRLSAAEAVPLVRDAEAAITSWGAPKFDAELLEAAPRLKLLVHAAGTVKPFVSPELFARGVRVSSSASAIAEDVAVTALGYIICGLKNAFLLSNSLRGGGWRKPELAQPRDIFGKTIGVIGASRVGRALLKLLRPLPVTVLLSDPFVDAAAALALGAQICSLEELLSRSHVVTIHAPAIEPLRNMFNAEMLSLLRSDVLLVNTARGMLVNEAELVDFMRTRPNSCAILDVTDPEPPAEDSPLRRLPNVILTPHIAGSTESGLARIGRHVLHEIDAFFSTGQLKEEVTREMLERIA